MSELARDARSPLTQVELIERIGDGSINSVELACALKGRRSLVTTAGEALSRLIRQGRYAAGDAAVLLEDRDRQDRVLQSHDTNAQIAVLACAAYLHDRLPNDLVGRLLDSSNRRLSKAAESYLEFNDSSERRELLLGK